MAEFFREASDSGILRLCWSPEVDNLNGLLAEYDPKAAVVAISADTAVEDLVAEMRSSKADLHIVLALPNATTASVVRAIKAGADDFLVPPLTMSSVRVLLENLGSAFHDHLNTHGRHELPPSGFDGFPLGIDPGFVEVLWRAYALSSKFSSLLITGETGTGKEVLARAIHRWSGRRGALVPCNCAALSEHLFESTLFGHKRGSFTGAVSDQKGLAELADGGILLLDEVGELSTAHQAKVLRFLQTMEIQPLGGTPTRVDVRIIAATNRPIREMVAAKTFRDDLYYRLGIAHLHLPPLRERPGDIRMLVHHFAGGAGRNRLSRRAEASLVRHSWPGNVRELKNALEYASMVAGGREIDITDLPEYLLRKDQIPGDATVRKLADIERDYVLDVLASCRGNRSRAAEALGIGRATLYRILGRDGGADSHRR